MPATDTFSKRKLLIAVLIAAVVAGGAGISLFWLNSKPRAQRTPPKVLAPLVTTQTVAPATHAVTIEALGTVTAAQSVELSAQVSGEVVEVSPRLAPGARFAEGELLARIDPADYELALRQKEAELVKASYELEVEKGEGAVARSEYELLGESIDAADRALVLREPHLKAARAAVDAAEAAVEQARLDLNRTRITAPFNAVVKERSVAVGMQLGSGTKIATLVDSDRYWIEAALPVSQLSRIRFGTDASSVRIAPRSTGQTFPEGRVIGLLSDVDDQGRMARLLIEVPHPLENGRGAPLLLGDIVNLEISGIPLKNLLMIPRADVRNGSAIWLLSPEKRLKIVPVVPVWSQRDAIYIAPETIPSGYALITTDLTGAVDGMTLREAGEK